MKFVFETVDATGEFARSAAYKDYAALVEYAGQLRERMGLVDSLDEYPEKFFDNMEMYIRYAAFRKLGKGSSRTAYSFDADLRYALKFAHNENGLKQNRAEVKNAKAGSADYACTVRVLEYSADDMFIVEDLCRESSYEDWDRIVGISPHMLSKIVRTVFEKREDDPAYSLRDLRDELEDVNRAAQILKKESPLDDDFRVVRDYKPVMACVNGMLDAYDGKSRDPKWVALADLVRFYCDNGMSSMIPEELLYVDQWGVRSGATPDEDSLVIIDPGVDEDFLPFVGQDGERVR